jgi:hypothetical protein
MRSGSIQQYEMGEIALQFSTSTAFTSGIIRRLTHSPWSHVDFVLPEGLLGVSGEDRSINDPGGVRVRPFGCWPYLSKPRTAYLHCPDNIADKVLDVARSQIGKPFDNGALWGFLGDLAYGAPKIRPAPWDDEMSWFCSEYIAFCLVRGGFFPYKLIVRKERISPADLLLILNASMLDRNIEEFLT